jgi:hypothetical protein
MRAVRNAVHRNSVDLHENFGVCEELAMQVAAEIALEDCTLTTIALTIEMIMEMIERTGSDTEKSQSFIRIWAAVVGGITDNLRDKKIMQQALDFTNELMRRYPDDMMDVLTRFAGTYGVIYQCLRDLVAAEESRE